MTFGVIPSNLPVKSHTACLDVLGLGHQRRGMDGGCLLSEGVFSGVNGWRLPRTVQFEIINCRRTRCHQAGRGSRGCLPGQWKIGRGKLAKLQKLYSISGGKLGENSPHLSVITKIVYYWRFCSSWDLSGRKLEALSYFSSSLTPFLPQFYILSC